MVETQADIILEAAKTQNVSFLVVGDPFGYVILSLLSYLFFHFVKKKKLKKKTHTKTNVIRYTIYFKEADN